MMMHLKAVRVFVESVLRYGLTPKATGMGAGPGPNFQSVLLQPKKGKEDHLHKALCSLYGGGSAINIDVRTPSAPPTAPPSAPRSHLRTSAGGRDAGARRDGRVLPVRLRADGHGGAGHRLSWHVAYQRGQSRARAGPEQDQRRACGVLRGSSGQAGRRALQRGRVWWCCLVGGCERRVKEAEGGWGYASNCALFIGDRGGRWLTWRAQSSVLTTTRITCRCLTSPELSLEDFATLKRSEHFLLVLRDGCPSRQQHRGSQRAHTGARHCWKLALVEDAEAGAFLQRRA